jgi:hypothetical protein
MTVAMGSDKRCIKESEVYAEATSKGRPVLRERITKVAKVAKGASVCMLSPGSLLVMMPFD